MLKWALILFIISVLAALFGFTSMAAIFLGIAKLFLALFLILSLAFLIGELIFGATRRSG